MSSGTALELVPRVAVVPDVVTDNAVTNDVTDNATCCTMCAGCIGGAVILVMALACQFIPLILSIYGIIVAAEQYADIPDCAGHYRAWLITMIILLACNVKVMWKQQKQDGNTDDPPPDGVIKCVSHSCVAFFVGLIPLLGYLLVVENTSDDCNIASMDKVYDWTLYVIYYSIFLAGTILVKGGGLLFFLQRRHPPAPGRRPPVQVR